MFGFCVRDIPQFWLVFLSSISQKDLPKGTKDVVPEHDVLTVVALWNTVVDIVHLRIIDCQSKYRNDNVVARVIEAGQYSTDRQEQNTSNNVDLETQGIAAKEKRQKMIVFSQEKLKRVHIYRIDVGSTSRMITGDLIFQRR